MLLGERKRGQHLVPYLSFHRCLVRLVFATAENSTDGSRWGKMQKLNYRNIMWCSLFQGYTSNTNESMQGGESGCPPAVSKTGWADLNFQKVETRCYFFSFLRLRGFHEVFGNRAFKLLSWVNNLGYFSTMFCYSFYPFIAVSGQ